MTECISEQFYIFPGERILMKSGGRGREPVIVIPEAALRDKIDRAKKDMVLAPRDIGLQLVHVINALESIIPPESAEVIK